MADNSSTSNFKYIIKYALFVCALLPLIYIAGNKYSEASTVNKINGFNKLRWDEFYASKPDSIDMLFIGSSHSYCTYDPEKIDAALGTNSYQLGMPLQHPDSTYFTLLEALNTQNPKTVVFDVYWDMLDDEFELVQAGYLFQVLRDKELEEKYIKEVFPLAEKIKYNVKLFRYQQDYFAFKSSTLKEDIMNRFDVTSPATQSQVGEEAYHSKGYTYCTYTMLEDEYDKTNQFKGVDGSKIKFTNAQLKYMDKIIKLCKERDIELILTTAPIANPSLEYIKNYDKISDRIQKIADENSLRYLDFNLVNQNEHIFADENFRDDAHLNDSGVKIADEYFCKWYKAQ